MQLGFEIGFSLQKSEKLIWAKELKTQFLDMFL